LVSDTWNLKFPHFSQISVSIPDVTEQRKIASLLKNADREIAALTSQLEALREEKRALMADLLTGKRRVTVPTPEPLSA
jgi:type I restriction enzyme S subunit